MLRIAALLALGTGCADKTGLAPIASGGPGATADEMPTGRNPLCAHGKRATFISWSHRHDCIHLNFLEIVTDIGSADGDRPSVQDRATYPPPSSRRLPRTSPAPALLLPSAAAAPRRGHRAQPLLAVS